MKLSRRLIKDLTEDPVANPNIPNVLFETNWAEDDEVKAENFIRQIIQSFKASMKMDERRLHDEYQSETTDSWSLSRI